MVIQGKRLTESESLVQMNIPYYEDVVEVEQVAVEALLDEGADT